MKNVLLIALLLCSVTAQAQFAFGLRGGLHTQVNHPQDIVVDGPDTSFSFGVEDLKFGTQFGLWLRVGKGLFFQPELVFNSNRTDFRIGQTSAGDIILAEKYQHLDMPLMVGVSTGFLRLYGGPVGHYFLNSTSDLVDVKGYSERWKQFTWGWQAGLNVGIGRISGDVRYEGNFSKFGDHVNFFGQPYHFANTPARLILALQIALVK